MNYPCRLLSAVLCIGLSLPASAAINAWLDQNRIGNGETVQLTLEHDGQTDSQPDLGPLKQDFDILGRSSGSSIQIVNGKMSAKVRIDLTLAPKHGGKLLVPALQWDGQATPALALTVSNNGAPTAQTPNAAPGNTADTFITTTLDQQQPYVQAAVTLTVRLYVDQPLAQASLELEPGNDVQVQQVGQDRQFSETRNGHNYQVVERKYLLFPQRSGRIRIDGPVLNAQVMDRRAASPFGQDPFFGNVFGSNPFAGMMTATRPLRIRGDQIVLDVRPRPKSGTGHAWLPAQGMTLTETWQPANGPIHEGDPITRSLHLSAQGLTASQLPDLSLMMPLPPGLRAYPDQAKLDNGIQGGSVIGSRDQNIALIATRAGLYKLPALHLYWWDTTKNLQREVDLPARTLEVLPNAQGFAASTTPPAQDAGPPPSAANPVLTVPTPQPAAAESRWPWVSLALGLLWLGTLFAWWNSRRQGPRSNETGKPEPATAAAPRITDARKAFRKACRENDPQEARRSLLAWAQAAWPEDPPTGLGGLSKGLNDPELESRLKQLDRACYAGGEWRGETLLEKMPSLPARSRPPAGTTGRLAGLYPV
jgi:hypothetical protein